MGEKQVADDYKKILQNAKLDLEFLNIDNILTCFDEFETLLFSVKAQTNSITNNCRDMHDFRQEYLTLCKKLEKLETFVNIVDSNVGAMERSIEIAEKELNIPNFSLKGFILPIIYRNKGDFKDQNKSKTNLNNVFHPIPIFKTGDYFINPIYDEKTERNILTK